MASKVKIEVEVFGLDMRTRSVLSRIQSRISKRITYNDTVYYIRYDVVIHYTDSH